MFLITINNLKLLKSLKINIMKSTIYDPSFCEQAKHYQKNNLIKMSKNQLQNLVKAVLLLTVYYSLNNVFAQAPQIMSYQAVVRNAANTLIANATVGVKISVLQTTASGTVVYSERHTPTTNANGLATLEIGDGTVLFGTMAGINWANGPFFIKTETDPDGGSNYTIAGTSQLASVPYALFAANTGTPDSWVESGGDITNVNAGNVGIGITPTEKLQIDGNAKLGNTIWTSVNNDRMLKFGDANFVTIGEVGGDDEMQIKANKITLSATSGNVLIPSGNIGVGNTGSINNKLQIGNPPGFFGNDLAIGNGITGMSIAVSTTAATFFTNTDFAFMPASGPGNVGIGKTNPGAKLDVEGSMRVSENSVALGTVFKQIQAGNHFVGPSDTDGLIVTVTFPNSFATPPHIIATARNSSFVNDTYAVTIRSVSNNNFVINILRRDSGITTSGWSQNLTLDWMAFSY